MGDACSRRAPDGRFYVGENVRMRYKDQAWRYGTVVDIRPLKVRFTWGKEAFEWDEVEKATSLRCIQGSWKSVSDGALWKITEDGKAFLNGERSAPGGDLVEEEGYVKRLDGWEVDMALSTAEMLLWKKDGESLEWHRLSSAESPAIQTEVEAESEDEDDGSRETLFRKPLQKQACRGCWDKKGTSICRRCNRVKYCSQECQKNHWPVHKQFCGKGDGHLRTLWGTQLATALQKDGPADLSYQRQFVQYVGGDFWYANSGLQIFHTMLHMSPALKKSRVLRKEYDILLNEALELDADVNAKCDTGETPLHLACRSATKEAKYLIRFLLSCPSLDLDIPNGEGQVAEDVCVSEEIRALVAQERASRKEAKEQQEAERLAAKAEEKERRLAAQPRRQRCRHCWQPGVMICRRCNFVQYCSVDCQKKDWPVHQQMCGKKIVELSALLVGTIASLFGDDMGSSCIDLSGVRAFLAHVGRDIRIDISLGWWIAHTIVGLILKLDLHCKALADLQKDIAMLLQDVVDFEFDINAQNADGDTALHMLCMHGGVLSQYAAIWLLQHAPINQKTQNLAGRTALESCHAAGFHPSKAEYYITLDKDEKDVLGLNLECTLHNSSKALVARGLRDGLVLAWNEANPERSVQIGDTLAEVNRITDAQSMMDECKKQTKLDMKWQRSFKRLLDAFEGIFPCENGFQEAGPPQMDAQAIVTSDQAVDSSFVVEEEPDGELIENSESLGTESIRRRR